ncbi:hypothetical protein FEM48_Zijuj04G0068600 [Ziziphus jujuba var. spinosa]|uniref:Uncharacterized protein n=1 Tax=Ziziphus jujuba var. spinosa TaxID=714518 RepID=A0A978VIF3_ZIZJJ|nr:hypothetical protein FEM48_Zijuj04G0068600 [Ziziphus jujuba var. spinosa]
MATLAKTPFVKTHSLTDFVAVVMIDDSKSSFKPAAMEMQKEKPWSWKKKQHLQHRINLKLSGLPTLKGWGILGFMVYFSHINGERTVTRCNNIVEKGKIKKKIVAIIIIITTMDMGLQDVGSTKSRNITRIRRRVIEATMEATSAYPKTPIAPMEATSAHPKTPIPPKKLIST